MALLIQPQEDTILALAQTEEIAVIYAGSCPARAGRMRRLPLAARKIETAALRFPVARTRVKTCKKESFNSCGEATSFQPTYSGVSFRSVKELPLISLAEKQKVFPQAIPAVQPAPDQYQEEHGSDQPLFWQESKPIALWLALLDELKIQCVFDVTAGSGALMEACLTRGILYHGLCLNREHMSWLQAVSDRAACGLISVEGSTLYSDELAKAVKERFPEVLQALLSDGPDEEEALEPESDEGD